MGRDKSGGCHHRAGPRECSFVVLGLQVVSLNTIMLQELEDWVVRLFPKRVPGAGQCSVLLRLLSPFDSWGNRLRN